MATTYIYSSTSIEERALTQLESYIAASFVAEKYPHIGKKPGGYIAPGSFPYLSITGDAYSVVYSSEFTPGIIRYSFKKMSADEKRVNAGSFYGSR